MNALGREIRSGEVVLVAAVHFRSDANDDLVRRFVCKSGFGMSMDTEGDKIFGYWISDPRQKVEFILGSHIDKEETICFQEVGEV